MSLDSNVRTHQVVNCYWYSETPESQSSPRGLEEADLVIVKAEPLQTPSDVVRVTISNAVYYVRREALLAMATVDQ